MKKIIVLLLAGVIVLTACHQSISETTAGTEETAAPYTSTGTTTQTLPPATEPESPNQDLNWKDAYRAVIASFAGMDSFEDTPYGARLFDINGDGIPELLLSYGCLAVNFGVYTFANGEAVYSGRLIGGAMHRIPDYNGIYIFTGVSPYGTLYTRYFELINNELLEINESINLTKTFAEGIPIEYPVTFAYFVNKVEVSEQEFENAVKQYFNEDNRILLYNDYYLPEDAEKMFSDYGNSHQN